MPDKIKFIGLDETEDAIKDTDRDVQRDEFYQVDLKAPLRYAMSISPVLTGAYRDSHRIAVKGKRSSLFVDPNARSGRGYVSQYAGVIEGRLGVYAKTAKEVDRLAVDVMNKRVEDSIK